MTIGERASWLAVNGPCEGEVEQFCEKGILVRLDNGKCVILNENSIKDETHSLHRRVL